VECVKLSIGYIKATEFKLVEKAIGVMEGYLTKTEATQHPKSDALYRRNINYRVRSLRSLLTLFRNDEIGFVFGMFSAVSSLAR
jgi:hypothetical protein